MFASELFKFGLILYVRGVVWGKVPGRRIGNI